jgi:hypothetical protein
MDLKIIIPNNTYNTYNTYNRNTKKRYIDTFIGTNKEWESLFFDEMSKEDILKKVISLLYDAEDHLELQIKYRNFSRYVERKYLSISDSVILGLNLLPCVNTKSYTQEEIRLLDEIAKIQKRVLSLYNYFRELKKVWFN